MHLLKSEHLFSYTASLHQPVEVIGPVPEGIHTTFYISGGELLGPRLKGRMLGVGADGAVLRTDGMLAMNVRTTLQTDDGALIHLRYEGLGDLGLMAMRSFSPGSCRHVCSCAPHRCFAPPHRNTNGCTGDCAWASARPISPHSPSVTTTMPFTEGELKW